MLDRVSSLGLVFSTKHRLILMAALVSRSMNSLRALALVELINARSPRNCALCAITVSSSSLQAHTFSGLSHLIFFSRSSARRGFYPNRIGKYSNARGMVKCHVVQWKDIARSCGKSI